MIALWQKKQGNDHISLRLPEKLAIYRQDSKYQINDLVDWFELQIKEIAKQFDRRNGNNYYSEKIGKLSDLSKYSVDYPVNSKPNNNIESSLDRANIFDTLK